jgi:hypothetical protein
MLPFSAASCAQLDSWQRVYDIGNGAGAENVFLGQIGTSSDMQFMILNGTNSANIVAKGAIVDPRPVGLADELVGPRDVLRDDALSLGQEYAVLEHLTITPFKGIPEIDGAFKMFAEVRFDDLAHGNYLVGPRDVLRDDALSLGQEYAVLEQAHPTGLVDAGRPGGFLAFDECDGPVR